MASPSVRLMKDRRYELLPTEEIVVLNSRDRDPERFQDNIRSIETVGLLKPILVNGRFRPETGKYELVCGQGRLQAYRELGRAQIAAEVIDCDRREAYLLSLVENIARVPAEAMWFAREVKRLKDSGMPLGEISRIVGKPEAQIAGYATLVEKGEDRLLRGVEEGEFPITFALEIAKCDEAGLQNLLMDAFDQGLVGTANLRRIRRIVKERMARPAGDQEANPGEPAALDRRKSEEENPGDRRAKTPEPPPPEKKYTVEDLKRDIAKTTREKNSFIREASLKEGRLMSLLECLKRLRSEESFCELLRAEGLPEMPALEGNYGGLAERETVKSHG